MTRRSLAAALVLLAACGESVVVEPAVFGGRYELRSSDGAPLPRPHGAAQTIQRGALDVVSADTLRVTLGVGTAGGGPVTDQSYVFRYQRVGDSLLVALPAGSGGRVHSGAVFLRVGVPLPPSQGLGLVFHDLTFQR